MNLGKVYAIGMGVDAVEGIGQAPFASNAVRHLVETMSLPPEQAILLVGPAATRSALESRLRKLARSLVAGDRVLFVYAGPGLVDDGESCLACADTLDDDRLATAISLADLQRRLEMSGVEAIFVLDAVGVDVDAVADLFEGHETHACLLAASAGESSHASAGQRLWLTLLSDALAGKAIRSGQEQQGTVGAVHRWAKRELPKLLRQAIEGKVRQTPLMFGNDDLVLVDRSQRQIPASSRIDLNQLKQLVFRGEARTKLKDARGALKASKLPDVVNASSKKWAIRLAADDLRDLVETTYQQLREHLGLKRKDLETSISADGVGIIRGPGFDTTIDVQLDPDDPGLLLWRREISRVTDVSMLRSDGFRRVFGGKLDCLEAQFASPVDVVALVDQIEDDPPPGLRLQVASDGRSCELTIPGMTGKVRIDRFTLRVEGGLSASMESLLEQFLAFQQQFSATLPAIGAT